jgi:hypothetical protein
VERNYGWFNIVNVLLFETLLSASSRFGWFARIPAKTRDFYRRGIVFTDRVEGSFPFRQEFSELKGRATPKRSIAERNE